MTVLSKRRLDAVIEALHLRLAGAMDHAYPEPEDYRAALAWAEELKSKREDKKRNGLS